MGFSPHRGAADREPHPAARRRPRRTRSPRALEIEPKLKALLRHRADASRSCSTQAIKLEGLTRHAGMHAAGVVISEGPLWDHVPGLQGRQDRGVRHPVLQGRRRAGGPRQVRLPRPEDAHGHRHRRAPHQRASGSQKDDRAVRHRQDPARRHARPTAHGSRARRRACSSSSRAACSSSSRTSSPTASRTSSPPSRSTARVRSARGMVEGLRRLQARSQADREDARPASTSILEPTYGVIVYQEQVMQIAQALAGYSLGGADLLRRAMGKKKPEEMAKQKSDLRRRRERATGVDEADAERIFGLLEFFAGYGFNKSHSAAYALITYQTAYLKAHYPVELLCAIMTRRQGQDRQGRAHHRRGARDGRHGAPARRQRERHRLQGRLHAPRAANKRAARGERTARREGPAAARRSASASAPCAALGEGGARGAPRGAQARAGRSPISSTSPRASTRKRINKGVFEALVAVRCVRHDARGARHHARDARSRRSRSPSSDQPRGEPRSRARSDEHVRPLRRRRRKAGACGGAPSAGGYVPTASRGIAARCSCASSKALGFYVSGHPLERYLKGGGALVEARRRADVRARRARRRGRWCRSCGMVEGYRERIFKDGGGKIAFFDARGPHRSRDREGARQRRSTRTRRCSRAGEPVLITGKVSFPFRGDDAEPEEEGPKEPTLLLNEAVRLSDSVKKDTKQVVDPPPRRAHQPRSTSRRWPRCSRRSNGNCPVQLVLAMKDGAEAFLSLGKAYRVEVSRRGAVRPRANLRRAGRRAALSPPCASWGRVCRTVVPSARTHPCDPTSSSPRQAPLPWYA